MSGWMCVPIGKFKHLYYRNYPDDRIVTWYGGKAVLFLLLPHKGSFDVMKKKFEFFMSRHSK